MKLHLVLGTAALVRVAMALSVPSSGSSLDNSLLDGSFNITGAFHVSAEVTTAANDEQQWATNVARGRKLLAAMKGSDLEAATLYGLGTTAKSKYDGDLKDEMRKWGWNDNTPKQKATFDKQCDFIAYHKIGRCFAELGLGTKSKGAGGPNECFVAEHWDGPAVKKTIPGVMPKPKNQRYEVCKVMYRSTEGYHRIGVNAPGGAIMALDRRSPASAAETLWGHAPNTDELPHIRAASDFAWAFWSRATAGGGIRNIRYFFNCLIVNEETQALIRRAHEMMTPPRSAPGMWPGTEFRMDSEQGLALLGSPLGRWGGYFLLQHKEQLGGNKVISKARVFKNDAMTLPYMVFYVEDASTGSASGGGSDDGDVDILGYSDIGNVVPIRARL